MSDSDQSAANGETRSRTRSRLTLIAVFGIAFGTYFAAYLFQPFAVSLTGSTNLGEFVEPRVPVESFAGDTLSKGRFHLLVVPPGDCVEVCRDAVKNLRQMQVLLGKDAARVRRVVVNASGALASQAELRSTFPKLVIVETSELPAALSPAAYIVDPHGDAVLRYTFEEAHKPMLEDLRRMLKNSRAG